MKRLFCSLAMSSRREDLDYFSLLLYKDTNPYWIENRVITTSFKAEKTLTKDTVPVGINAVFFWKKLHPEKIALQVAEYVSAFIGKLIKNSN